MAHQPRGEVIPGKGIIKLGETMAIPVPGTGKSEDTSIIGCSGFSKTDLKTFYF